MSLDRTLLLLTPALLFISPLISGFAELKVPLFREPSLLFVGGIVLLGLAIGCAAALAYRPGNRLGKPRMAVCLLILASVLLMTFDLAAQGHRALESLPMGEQRSIKLIAISSLFTTVFAFLWLVRTHVAKIIFTGAFAFFLASAAVTFSLPTDNAETSAVTQTKGQRPVIHLIFDELTGPEAIDASLSGGPETYHKMRTVFERHGFRLYGNVYSRHAVTVKALPSMLNFDFSDNRSYGFNSIYTTNPEKPSLTKNRLFELMRSGGRTITVHQTSHLDFCSSGEVEVCRTFSSFNPLGEHVPKLQSTREVTFALLQKAFAESYVVTNYLKLVKPLLLEVSTAEKPYHYDVHSFPSWFETFASDVLTGEPAGRYIFAHFLMPHAPYVYDKACRLRERWFLPWFLAERHNLEGQDLEQARRENYAHYFEQTQCLLSTIDGFLTQLDSDTRFADAFILIHGDHGARLSARRHAEGLTTRDMIDNYPTLFAVKGPGIALGYDLRKVSLQRLVAELFHPASTTSAEPDDGSVAVDSTTEGVVVARHMPSYRYGSDMGRATAPP
ncbi:MAG: sulfatase-like hydrolase/transferase [Betaproteobacteria bacterium]|nr:sulfatase-like hydrolase/transferase [Betaproteobacteria bacterium]